MGDSGLNNFSRQLNYNWDYMTHFLSDYIEACPLWF